MFTVHFLARDLRRDDAGGLHHIGLQRPLQMLAQIARLPSEERNASAEVPCAAEQARRKVKSSSDNGIVIVLIS